MKIHLQSSGGLANIQLAGSIDTDDLPDALAKKAASLLTPERLRSAAAAPNPLACDARQMTVGLIGGADSSQFELDETSADADVWATCEELLREIIRRKMQERR